MNELKQSIESQLLKQGSRSDEWNAGFNAACKFVLGEIERLENSCAFEVGDLIEAIPPYHLASGSFIYPRAVLVSTKPFVAVSEGGDMLWSATIAPEKVKRIGKALTEVLFVAMNRWERHRDENMLCS